MESVQQPNELGERFTMSWTAYVRPIIIFLVMVVIGLALTGTRDWLGAIFILFWLSVCVVQILTIRSIVLYTDAEGVWVYRGIFPWSKGMFGIKWRDVEDATFVQNFLSWVFKSYTVRVGHRFTKASEIVLPHIRRGSDAVMHINERHRHACSAEQAENLA
ncbi:hypothetical protein RSO41_01425 [Halomonas sp. I1]|uniref:hypothetical protein n=1 Tax=Halomonas sp. I1 TaxID=393536 RepID=UPI0028DE2434|nr:hypothetical protein [Halomonas sp. I1]MDT8893301.1 hypothetical protein [Halomonas sp. I1]